MPRVTGNQNFINQQQFGDLSVNTCWLKSWAGSRLPKVLKNGPHSLKRLQRWLLVNKCWLKANSCWQMKNWLPKHSATLSSISIPPFTTSFESQNSSKIKSNKFRHISAPQMHTSQIEDSFAQPTLVNKSSTEKPQFVHLNLPTKSMLLAFNIAHWSISTGLKPTLPSNYGPHRLLTHTYNIGFLLFIYYIIYKYSICTFIEENRKV